MKYNISLVIVSPMLSSFIIPGIPGLGSNLEPAEIKKVNQENSILSALSRLYKFRDSVYYLGYSNHRIIRRLFKKKGIPQKFRQLKNNVYATLFSNIPQLILAPEELEYFPDRKLGNQVYSGCQVDWDRIEKFNSPAFEQLFNSLTLIKENTDTKIIFCSFGSMHGEWNTAIVTFLQKLFAVIAKIRNYKLVCSFNDFKNQLNKNELSDNIFLFDRLPQLKILEIADLFITHAGLGSIKESIMSGVPMLAYPFTKKWDSTGNASKIQYHVLGLKGNMDTDSENDIAEKIAAIFLTKKYENNIEIMKTLIDTKYSARYVLDIFESLKKTQSVNVVLENAGASHS
ncbi:MAG: glycosyltransferase [Bacteroidota bacterium]